MRQESITFVDDLFAFCAQTGFVGGRQEDNRAIVFEMGDHSELRLDLAHAQGTFRTMCARLCKISNDLNPALNNIYRGVATMPYKGGAIQIDCENRLAKHYFKLKFSAIQAAAGDCATTPFSEVGRTPRAGPDRRS